MSELGLFLLGLSHKTAPVEVRERCALEPAELERRLRELVATREVREAWLLSTCNRTEALVVAERDALDSGAAEGVVRRALFERVPLECQYAFRGVEAVIHVFRVASGLDSLVLGESQVLAQVKEALSAARRAESLGGTLEALLERALVCGKRVRAETAVGSGTLSVARAGVGLAQHVVGRLDDASVLIVGAGETARLVARHLREHDVGRLTIASRTLEHASDAAREAGALAAGLEGLQALVLEADLVVACVDGAPGLVTVAPAARRKLAQRDRPLVVVDLSVPRAVHAELAAHPHVFVYDLDDVAKLVDTNQRARQRSSEEAAPILVAEVHKFLGLRAYASFSPAIARLRERFESVREQELDAVAGPHASSELVQLAHRLTSHLLDVALSGLKETARDSVEPESLASAYARFLREP